MYERAVEEIAAVSCLLKAVCCVNVLAIACLVQQRAL
jgi:hypothetical protein